MPNHNEEYTNNSAHQAQIKRDRKVLKIKLKAHNAYLYCPSNYTKSINKAFNKFMLALCDKRYFKLLYSAPNSKAYNVYHIANIKYNTSKAKIEKLLQSQGFEANILLEIRKLIFNYIDLIVSVSKQLSEHIRAIHRSRFDEICREANICPLEEIKQQYDEVLLRKLEPYTIGDTEVLRRPQIKSNKLSDRELFRERASTSRNRSDSLTQPSEKTIVSCSIKVLKKKLEFHLELAPFRNKFQYINRQEIIELQATNKYI